LCGRWSIAEMAGLAAIFCRSRDDPAAANPATPLLTLRWTFPAKRASVVVTHSEPNRLAPLPRQRPVGLRGVWVVAARCCAGPSERSFACPSANAGEPPRRRLDPLSNVAPAMVISLISVAYIEEDGLLLSAAFLAAIILIGIASAAVWGTIVGAVLVSA